MFRARAGVVSVLAGCQKSWGLECVAALWRLFVSRRLRANCCKRPSQGLLQESTRSRPRHTDPGPRYPLPHRTEQGPPGPRSPFSSRLLL